MIQLRPYHPTMMGNEDSRLHLRVRPAADLPSTLLTTIEWERSRTTGSSTVRLVWDEPIASLAFAVNLAETLAIEHDAPVVIVHRERAQAA
jgi:hypothetical protein